MQVNILIAWIYIHIPKWKYRYAVTCQGTVFFFKKRKERNPVFMAIWTFSGSSEQILALWKDPQASQILPLVSCEVWWFSLTAINIFYGFLLDATGLEVLSFLVKMTGLTGNRLIAIWFCLPLCWLNIDWWFPGITLFCLSKITCRYSSTHWPFVRLTLSL